MKLRWAIYKNHVTGDQVREYHDNTACGRQTAKRLLINEKHVLEYEYAEGVWIPVETEIIYRNKPQEQLL